MRRVVSSGRGLVLVIFGLLGSADRLGLSLFSFRLGTIFLVAVRPGFYPLVDNDFVGVRLGARRPPADAG